MLLEEGTPWSNKAELYIGLLKEAIRKDMRESHSPLAFWDYCVERRACVHNLTVKSRFNLHGSNPHTATFGTDGDISALCQYAWYEWCYFRDQSAGFPDNKEVLGRILGPARGAGNEMAQWVLKANGNVVACRSHRPLTTAESYSPVEQKKRDIFDELIQRRWGDSITLPNPNAHDNETDDDNHDDTEDIDPVMEDAVDSTGRAINQQPLYDKLINAEVMLQQGDSKVKGTVKRRTIGPDGRTSGTYDDNPILNSVIYDVEFPDGQVKEYSANIIAENMHRQVDEDGYSRDLMEGIIDYSRDNETAVDLADKYLVTRSGQRRMRKTTKGWKLLVKWRDGSETWGGAQGHEGVPPCGDGRVLHCPWHP